MNCNYIGVCGGCTLGNLSYDEQLNLKIQREKHRFKDIYSFDMDTIKSDTSGFRNRVEFRIFHKNGIISYAMSGIDKKILTIQNCNIVNQNIAFTMTKLLDMIQTNDILCKKLFSIEFLSSSIGDLLITLIYHKKLDKAWEDEGIKLQQKLKAKIIGRSRKQKVILSDDFVCEKVLGFDIRYFDGSFTQPNAKVNVKMITWVLDNINSGGDLCELYCGNGNFTIPLSFKFNQVIATEISKTSIKNGKLNCDLNNITNIKFVRLSSQEFAEAMDKTREFRRLQQQNIDLQNYNFSTIFVDPPRCGLDDTTLKLVQNFNQIIYISCNSETLHRDLKKLITTHKIKNFALFDQFSFTHHIECGVVLEHF